MKENLKILILAQQKEHQFAIKNTLNNKDVLLTFTNDAVDGIGMLGNTDFDVLILFSEPFCNKEEMRSTMAFLRFANRNKSRPIIICGNGVNASLQLTLLDFGIKNYLSIQEIDIKLMGLIEDLTAETDFISILRNRAKATPGEYPIDIEKAITLANNDSPFMKMMFESFLAEVPNYFKNFKTCLDENNSEQVGEIAHKLKSPLNIIGVKHVIPQIEFIEQQLESENTDWGAIKGAYLEVYTNFTKALDEVKAIFEGQ